ncbi:hybrid sensor histidine kinase/response regulator [Pseudohalocynthiibacter aestuariivivens]|uniref:histidine kinase n=1 Tax=Roseovarius pelagicus TaxID=2980108 RepID=A0ABY6D7Z5_9RHOB|nr:MULTISPECIES: PAS-domain containing protein [Rhodobacterales]QIE45789.1 hybrid sensor histidine kinase/response regulator [Pseudohalocynthiibacter aestuariivivens]UXX82252.1 PAS-domain containing protein [Roseovarius pelagicus]
MISQQTTEMTMAGLNLIQQALTIYDSDLNLAVCNRRFQEMFDLPDALVTPGASFADTIRYLAQRGDYGNVGDLEQFVTSRTQIARAFEPHYMERTRANDRTISVEGSPLPQGGWVTVYTDITRTKQQESLLRTRSEELSDQLGAYSGELSAANRQLEATVTALEEAKRQITQIEARTRLTAEMMPAHISHVGPDRRYTFSNRRLSSIIPGTKSEIIGERIEDALGPIAYATIRTRLDQAFAGTASVFEFTHEPSSRRIRAALTPDTLQGGVYILSMDITEEAQTRAALQQTRRREVAAQMTSGLAHDFSNLLTIILGMQSKLARMDLPDTADTLISATQSAARRGGSLLNRIADMTGRREHSPAPTNLHGFLSELDTLARSALPDAMGFNIDMGNMPNRVLLDPGMLQDSLLNLVLNARDACGTTGQITLTVAAIQDTWIDFTVSDTGPGFSKTALSRAFEPFFTTKGGEGSGLGLVMVYDMTKLAGGRATIGNSDVGGVVTLRLPLRIAGQAPTQGLILLVEDSADLRDTVRDMLREAGHSVIEAASVPEARSLLAQLPEISALLSDIVLEGEQTGVDLAAVAPCPTFLMTSLPPSDPRFAAAVAAAPVLRKPFSAAELYAFLSAPSETT